MVRKQTSKITKVQIMNWLLNLKYVFLDTDLKCHAGTPKNWII